MQLFRSIKWLIAGMFLSTSVALACPGQGCQPHHCQMKQQGALCQTKDCPNAAQGKMCNMQGKMCDMPANKPCNKAMMPGHGKCAKPYSGKQCMFLKNLRYTLKHLDISKSDWKDVKIAMRAYKDTINKLQIVTPIKSIQGGKLDRKLFLNSHPMHQKLAAQADLLETILLILNSEQKKKFAMLMGASQYYNQLHPNRGMGCHVCMPNEIKLSTKPLKQ